MPGVISHNIAMSLSSKFIPQASRNGNIGSTLPKKKLGILIYPECWQIITTKGTAYNQNNIRHKTDVHPLTCRTNPTKNNVLNMGITLFNKLPEQLKKLETKHRFKNNVKKYLLQNVFYSVNEYLST